MATLSHKDSGFHFAAKTMTEERLKSFSIDAMATEMQNRAPDLWQLLKILLLADPQWAYKKEWARKRAGHTQNTGISEEHNSREFGEIELGDLDDDNGWEDVDADGEELQLVDEDEDEPEDIQEKKEEQFDALISIVTISCNAAQQYWKARLLEASFMHKLDDA